MRLIIGSGVIGGGLSLYWTKEGTCHHVSTRIAGQVSDNRPFISLLAEAQLADQQQYQTVILCAGISSILECRNDPIGTRKVNVDGTLKLAKYLACRGTRVIFISSDRVYDGTHPYRRPDDIVNPVTEYGRQKAETEYGILALHNSAVVRLTKVIYPSQLLLTNWVANLEAGRIITPFSDMWFAPISMDSVFKVIDRIIERKLEGIWHVSSIYEITYQHAAYRVAGILGAKSDLVQPCSFLDNKNITDAEAPRYTALHMEKTLDLGIFPIDPIETIQDTIWLSDERQQDID